MAGNITQVFSDEPDAQNINDTLLTLLFFLTKEEDE